MTQAETGIQSWADLLSQVETNSGVTKIPMATLRQLEGRQRVGKHILSAIQDKLDTLGLGHLPQDLPNRQQQSVMLYRYGTPAAEVIQAVRKGMSEPVDDSTFEYLHRLNVAPDPDAVIPRETAAEALEQTARSVLELLEQVRPATEQSAPVKARKQSAKVELASVPSRTPEHAA